MKGHHLDVRTALRFLYINHNLDLGVAFYSPSSRKLNNAVNGMTFSKAHILYFLLIFLQMDLMTIQQIVHSFWVPTIVTPSLSQPQAPSPTEVCSAFP